MKRFKIEPREIDDDNPIWFFIFILAIFCWFVTLGWITKFILWDSDNLWNYFRASISYLVLFFILFKIRYDR